MGFFDGVGDVAPGGGGNRLPAGQYLLEVVSCRVNQGFTGTRFIAEFEVIESSGEKALEIGATGSWTVELGGQFPKIGLAEVSAFWLACQGEDPKATQRRPTPDDVTGATDTRQTLKGKRVRTEAWDHKTRSGRDMVKHLWLPAAPGAQDAPPPAAGQVAPPPVPAAAPPPVPAPFPPPGWAPHPQAPGWFYRGQEVKTEADLRAGK